MVRVTGVQSQVESYQRLKKWYLMPLCLTLSNKRWGSMVKWSNPGKGVVPKPTPRCCSYWKGSLRVTLDEIRQLYFTNDEYKFYVCMYVSMYNFSASVYDFFVWLYVVFFSENPLDSLLPVRHWPIDNLFNIVNLNIYKSFELMILFCLLFGHMIL